MQVDRDRQRSLDFACFGMHYFLCSKRRSGLAFFFIYIIIGALSLIAIGVSAYRADALEIFTCIYWAAYLYIWVCLCSVCWHSACKENFLGASSLRRFHSFIEGVMSWAKYEAGLGHLRKRFQKVGGWGREGNIGLNLSELSVWSM